MGKTKIDWTEASWNPVRGCSIVSEGCRNCYAMRMARRSDRPGGAYEGLTRKGSHGPTWSGDVRFVPEMLDYPMRLRQPHRIFVNSMSDLFHEKVTDEQIAAIFGVMAVASQHTFQILTKRAFRMRHFMTHNAQADVYAVACRLDPTLADRWQWPLPNVWMGVSAEDQKSADERIPYLLEVPAVVRWVSLEPLLGPIQLVRDDPYPWVVNYLHGTRAMPDCDDPKWDKMNGLDWVVAGGESGPGARPTHPDWLRSLRDQCAAAGVPFFFKQWGRYLPVSPIAVGDGLIPKTAVFDVHGERIMPDCCSSTYEDTSAEDNPWRFGPVGKKAAGHILDGREHREYPVVKNSLATSAAPGA